MSVLVTQQAPDFKAQAVMPSGMFEEISLSDFRGKYVILFFYPLDFTFVCPTEIIAFSDRVAEFEALNVQILGVSVDSQLKSAASPCCAVSRSSREVILRAMNSRSSPAPLAGSQVRGSARMAGAL